MTASILYIAYVQACWVVLSAALVAVVLAMLLGVMFLSLLATVVRRWFA